MTNPQQNQEWNVQACAKLCAATNQPFADGQTIFSKLSTTADGFLRSDYCEAGWATEDARKGAISHWKGVFHAPPDKPEDPLKKGTVETLLRQFMAKEDYSKLAIVYILAVMLERKRILVEKEVQKQDNGSRIRVYEHKKTGEVFTIPDPDLKLNELAEVQAEVATLLGIPPKKEKGKSAPAPASPAH